MDVKDLTLAHVKSHLQVSSELRSLASYQLTPAVLATSTPCGRFFNSVSFLLPLFLFLLGLMYKGQGGPILRCLGTDSDGCAASEAQ
uniref:Uncharacterized protein n=1 Tax=Arundo donax TaxID=35708 RepID=A0A0A9FGA0_ARUDO